jgi:hypothetical protein
VAYKKKDGGKVQILYQIKSLIGVQWLVSSYLPGVSGVSLNDISRLQWCHL